LRFWKIASWFGGFLILSILLFLYFTFNGTPWGKVQQKQAMLSYLTTKYHKDFSISQMGYNPLSTGYFGIANPTSDPDLTFDVAQSVDSPLGYSDLYPAVLWKKSTIQPIKEYILNFFPDLDQSSFTIERQLGELLGPHVPPLSSLHYDPMNSGVLTIDLKEDWFQKTSDAQKADVQKIQQIAMYLQKKHFPVLTRFFYHTEDYNHWKAIYITQSGEIVQK
jgi:hypothetical protein